MKIYCKTTQPLKKGVGGSQVNKVGKYLFEHIDSSYKFEKSPNMYDVYITVFYQVPADERVKPEDEDLKEMHIDINITTYQNKLRVNVIEDDENEMTIGHFTVTDEQLRDIESAKDLIYNQVIKKVSKAYQDYDFVF